MVLESKGRKEGSRSDSGPLTITHSDPLLVFVLIVPPTLNSVGLEVPVIDWVVDSPILIVNETETA